MKSISPVVPLVKLQPQSTGPSVFTLAILAAVGYGGYRVYKHFRKG